MFFSPGYIPNEIGDFEIVEHEGSLHLFYLVLPGHDAVGHLQSRDGLHWTSLPWAICTGEPGEFDDDQIWTMGVCRKGDTWFMLYTAIQKRGRYQVTGLATSNDLIRWTKHISNPIAVADSRWYEAEQNGNFRIDWRDPHIVERNGVLHAFVCARENGGLLNHRGCAGYFTSEDGYKWNVQPPACTPRNSYDYECPSVFELNGRHYMVAIHGGHARATYRVAERVEGPYRRPLDDSITPGQNMSIRPCTFRGRTHLFHWNRGDCDWRAGTTGFSCVASPKLVHAETDGSLRVESFDWTEHAAGAWIDCNASTPAAPSCGEWRWDGDALIGRSEFGTGVWLTADEHQDYELTADVTLARDCAACEFGFALRADETGDTGLYARCVSGRGAIELVKQVHNRRWGPDSLWRGRSVLQQYHFTPPADGHYRLRLIAWGPNVEFNVNGRLALSFLSLPRRAGRVGVFVEDGEATFENIRLRPLREPSTNWK